MNRSVLASLLGLSTLLACSPQEQEQEQEQELNEPPPPGCTGALELRELPRVVDRTFPVGPVLTSVTTTSAVLMWEVVAPCSGVVSYGVAGGAREASVDSSVVETIHHATIEGLEADAAYDYEVSCGTLQTQLLRFWTAPANESPVRFTVWGDSQGHPELSGPVVDAMLDEQPHFTVHVGDPVSDGRERAQWEEQLFTPLGPLGHGTTTLHTMGNHEHNARSFYDYLAYSYDETIADTAVFGSNRAVRLGNTFVLLIDTNTILFNVAHLQESEATGWIREQMASTAAQSATWRVVAGHQPAVSESWGEGGCDRFSGNSAVHDWLMPLMEESGFELYVSGHTHAYERGRLGAVTHLITGGAGGDLDVSCRDLPEVEVALHTHHYLRVDAGCDRLTLTAIESPGGAILDEVVLTR